MAGIDSTLVIKIPTQDMICYYLISTRAYAFLMALLMKYNGVLMLICVVVAFSGLIFKFYLKIKTI